jgi:hypothetical protein
LSNRTTAVESTLNTPTTGVVARLGTEETTRASADTALATRATNLESTVNSATTGNTALQSRIATEETTRSTAVAAVASRTSTLETKAGNNGSYATANASFTAWPDGSALPSQWLPWNPGNYTRENSTFQDGAYMVGHVVPSMADSGFRTGIYLTPGYWVYDASVWCSAGNYQGAGLYADNLPSLNFSTVADNSGDIGVKAPGIRNWSLLVNSTFTGQVNFYAMGNWSSFGTTSAKTIHWLKAGLRPATDGESRHSKPTPCSTRRLLAWWLASRRKKLRARTPTLRCPIAPSLLSPRSTLQERDLRRGLARRKPLARTLIPPWQTVPLP